MLSVTCRARPLSPGHRKRVRKRAHMWGGRSHLKMGDQNACARADVDDTAGEAQRRPFTRLEITVGVPLRYIAAVQIRCRSHDAAQPLHAETSLPASGEWTCHGFHAPGVPSDRLRTAAGPK